MSLWRRNHDGCCVHDQACGSDVGWHITPCRMSCVGSSCHTYRGFTETTALPLPTPSTCSFSDSLLAFPFPQGTGGEAHGQEEQMEWGGEYESSKQTELVCVKAPINGNAGAYQFKKRKWRETQGSKNKSLHTTRLVASDTTL